MLNNSKAIKYIIFILLSSAKIFSLTPDPYPESRELFYSYESTTVLAESLNKEKRNISNQSTEQYLLLCESEYDLLMGISYLRDKNKRRAKEYLKSAYEKALIAFEMEESIYSYDQLSVTMIYYGLAQGVGGIISSAREANIYIEKILEIDPFYPDGLIMKSQKMIFAPRPFGGNPQQALRILEFNLRRLETLSRPQQFETLLGISQAHGRLGNRDEAIAFARQAESYYPANKDLQHWLEDL